MTTDANTTIIMTSDPEVGFCAKAVIAITGMPVHVVRGKWRPTEVEAYLQLEKPLKRKLKTLDRQATRLNNLAYGVARGAVTAQRAFEEALNGSVVKAAAQPAPEGQEESAA